MYKLTLKPLDVLFFGKRNFTLGEIGESNPLPFPHTLAGALTKVLRDKLSKTSDPFLPIKNIYGPFLHHAERGYLFPRPLDLVGERRSGKGVYKLTLKDKGELFDVKHTNIPENLQSLPFYIGGEAVEASDGFITREGLISYLTGREVEEEHLLKLEDVLTFEERIGIKREPNTKTTTESGLYRLRFVKFKPEVRLVFWVELANINFNLSELEGESFQLGGEGRLVRVESVAEDNLEALFKPLKPPQGEAKLLFLTPGYFRGRWLPENCENEVISGSLKGIHVAMSSQKGIWRAKMLQPGSVLWVKELPGTLKGKKLGFFDPNPNSDGFKEFIGSNLVVIGR